MKRRSKTIVAGLGLMAVAMCSWASSASADFHLMKIREITGDTMGGEQSYIELQMYAAGQNLVSGHNITVWDADGNAPPTGLPGSIQTHTLTGANPPNGDHQRTILIGDTGVANADFMIPQLSDYLDNTVSNNLTAAGAICFEAMPVDCVSWGNFTGADNLPDSTTPNGSSMPTGVLALQRNIGPNCPTLLEAADDTNNAGADFSLVGANPTPNSTAPVETGCTPPVTFTPPGNPTSPINPAGNVRKRKCKKKQKGAAAAKKKRCKKKKRG